MTHASPRVSLIGAGPGAADLITLRGYRRLQEADLVLYDALVAPELTDAAPQARRFCVGKRADRPSFDQATIENLMVKAARRGERVVRLKCGDPFVLGRGGEEALTLAKAGIQFEIIPGVSSAIAAAGLNAIPVTHRGITSNCVIVSGHKPEAFQPLLRSLPPGSSTVVGLMALRNRRQFAQAMLEQEWDAKHRLPSPTMQAAPVHVPLLGYSAISLLAQLVSFKMMQAPLSSAKLYSSHANSIH